MRERELEGGQNTGGWWLRASLEGPWNMWKGSGSPDEIHWEGTSQRRFKKKKK